MNFSNRSSFRETPRLPIRSILTLQVCKLWIVSYLCQPPGCAFRDQRSEDFKDDRCHRPRTRRRATSRPLGVRLAYGAYAAQCTYTNTDRLMVERSTAIKPHTGAQRGDLAIGDLPLSRFARTRLLRKIMQRGILPTHCRQLIVAFKARRQCRSRPVCENGRR